MTQSYAKTPIRKENSKRKATTQNADKKYDNTTIGDRVRAVTWSIWCGYQVNAPNILTPRLCNKKDTFKKKRFKWTIFLRPKTNRLL